VPDQRPERPHGLPDPARPGARRGAPLRAAQRGPARRRHLRRRLRHGRRGRPSGPDPQGDHDLRQAHGSRRGQAAHPRRARVARAARPAGRLGGDGHHRARVRRDGLADGGQPAGPGDLGGGVGEGQDRRAGRGGVLPHRRRRLAPVARPARDRHGGDHHRLRGGLLLRAAPPAARGGGGAARRGGLLLV
ncbi:MAG: CDP-diacylglycerol--glycerol-3-phosphate 3-phosphatidyltransferase, partial [uncultured Solirubrobacteraceae bacterium]